MVRIWFASVILLLVVGCSGRPQAALSPVTSGASLPPLIDINGNRLGPFEQPGVKAVAMVFVLPDCPIANSYLPAINRLHEELAPQGVELLIVQADPGTTAEQAHQHASEYGITAPVILDADRAWVRRAGATRTPEAVVFSPAGEILYRGRIDDQYVGLGQKRPQATSHELRNALAAILAGRDVPEPRTEAIGCFIPESPKGK
jgi:AhpC/TSA family